MRAVVVIAGMGPVGALLAALLGSRGVDTVVVEPQETPYPKPRAAVLDTEAIRGLALVPGLGPLTEWATPVARNGVIGADQRPLLMIEQTGLAYGYPGLVRLDQPRLEAGLRAAALATGCVRILAGRSVTGVEQDADQAVALLDDGQRVAGRWLVGCDGAGSTVREAAGIGFAGTTYPQPWLVVDAVGGEAEGGPSVAFVADATRPCVVMSQPGRWRWEWMLLPGEDPRTMTADEVVLGMVGAWTDPAGLEIERATVFTFHARMADRWRAGRVLLAGDAAHALPPFAGAGLGMGIRDAVTLAWRLGGDGTTLDGYERERRPDVRKTTALALRIGRIVQSRNRAVMRLTRAVLRAVALLPGIERAGERSPVVRRALPNPSVRVADGPPTLLDQVIGYRWAYIGHGCDPRGVVSGIPDDAVLLALDHPDPEPGCLPITDLDGLLAGRSGTVTVARPDRFLHPTIRTPAAPIG
ncbi:FAD-dependent monooxygenase [Actinoplanes sp. NPDC026670]|uniref:FAD-dependent monooxygenase n=1 Tax=Actinoplanes sp. NPDC026670 TaxID=3154700 RepID=UPI0033EA56E7